MLYPFIVTERGGGREKRRKREGGRQGERKTEKEKYKKRKAGLVRWLSS